MRVDRSGWLCTNLQPHVLQLCIYLILTLSLAVGVVLVLPLLLSWMLLSCRLQISTVKLFSGVCREGKALRLPQGAEHELPGTHAGRMDTLWFFLFLFRLCTVVSSQ